VRFLYKLYRENRGGILGDDMGLGKTIQSIALLAALLQMHGDLDCLARGGHVISGSSMVSKTRGSGVENYVGSSSKVFLIVCPTSVLRNWEQEFEAWGSFRVGIYHGAQREVVMAKAEAGDLEVVLTSHDMFRLYGMLLSSIKWDCVIVDEAHRLKNEKSKLYQACSKISTKRRFGLTGTIMQNKYIELFNVFEWAAPGSLGPREFFREYYDEPIKQGQRISAPDRFVKIAAERKEHLVSDPKLQYNDGVTLEGEFSPNHNCEMFICFARCGKAASWCMWS
jgi:SNF2 family DNA or RNA helicase